MLHVLRHYLPFRKVLLIVSETLLLTTVLGIGLSSHLWKTGDDASATELLRTLAHQSLDRVDAFWLTAVTAFLVSVIAQFAISFNELYDFRISSSPHARAARFMNSAGSAIAISIGVLLLVEFWNFERVLALPGLPLTHKIAVLTVSLVVGFGLLYIWRNFFHVLLRRFDFNERVLVLGNGRVAQKLAREMIERPNTGYQIVGMVAEPVPTSHDPRGRRSSDVAPYSDSSTGSLWRWQRPRPTRIEGATASADGQPAVQGTAALMVEPPPGVAPEDLGDGTLAGRSAPLMETVRRLQIDDIVVALEDRRGRLPIDELLQCRVRGVVVEEAEALFERITGKIAVEAMRPSYLIFNTGFRAHPMSEAAKRAADLLLASLILFFAWPVMALVALAVRLDSPGDILFRQERVGRLGGTFTLMKFRSMREDAEARTGPVWAQENDPRITRVGRFIRRTRLDEFPQLFNVLAGDMSMVGPRPEREHFVHELAREIPYYHQRHMVKPGLTGWAQINYPYGNTVEDALQKLQYDLFYIKYQSLLFDISILFNTIKTVVLRKGT